ncbi:MAG: tetratricopeptide repeat protein [Gemmatimonadales bacterium]
MSADPWTAAAEIFDAAVELSEEEREPFLIERCGGDRALLERVRAMLEADARSVPLLDSSPERLASMVDLTAPGRLVGRRIGPYTIRAELGRGGMGVVCLADRADVGKQVALKLVAGGLGSPEVVARFTQERRVLAQLDHPNIARLVDAGIEPDGTPWLAMDYVDGASIDCHADQRGLSIDDRLALFEEICAAVSYAHRHLVVHRDLKPANILVDDQGHPRLLDFGIAKLLDSDLAGPGLTRSGVRPMTPQYASPEQLEGKPISTASDVYQLGLLLYQLLTGRAPHRVARDGQDGAAREPLSRPSRVVSEPEEPVDGSPSEAKLAAARGLTVEGLRRSLEGDLDTIVLKATAPEPERRYASVELLAEDVRRHREGLPIQARPATLAYRIGKFVSRHRTWSVGVAMAVIGLLTVLVMMDRQARRIDRQRVRAEQALGLLGDLFTSADPLGGGADTVTVAGVLERGVARLRADPTLDPAVRGRLLAVVGKVYFNLSRPREALELYRESLDLLRNAAEPTDSVRIAVLSVVGLWTRDHALSAPLFAEALEAARRLPERRRLELATVLQANGTLYQQLGLTSEARPVYEEALAIYRSMPDSVPTTIDETLSDLGYLEESTGDLEAAVRYWREALAKREARLGPDHPEVASSKLALARGLIRVGEIDEAERLTREANVVQRRVLPSPHSRLANGLMAEAQLAGVRRRWAEAESLQRAGVEMYAVVMGDSSLILGRELANLANYVQSLGRLEEAERIHRDALGRYLTALGAEHPGAAVTTTNLAYNQFLQGRLAVAESLYHGSVPVLDSAWGDTPRIAGVLFDYALVLARLGRCEEAVPLFRRHVRLLGPGPEPHVSNGLGAFYAQARCLVVLDRPAEAEPLFRQADEWLVDRWGVEHPYARNSAGTLEEFYTNWGKPDSAARYRHRGEAGR